MNPATAAAAANLCTSAAVHMDDVVMATANDGCHLGTVESIVLLVLIGIVILLMAAIGISLIKEVSNG